MPDFKPLPSIAEAQRNPRVEQWLVQLEHLLEETRRQAEIIRRMGEEIAVLKGRKAKSKCKPSGMDTETEPGGDADESDAELPRGDVRAPEQTARPVRKQSGFQVATERLSAPGSALAGAPMDRERCACLKFRGATCRLW